MEDFWLDQSINDPDALGSVLFPYADDAIEAYEVSSLVNSARQRRPRSHGTRELTLVSPSSSIWNCSDPPPKKCLSMQRTSKNGKKMSWPGADGEPDVVSADSGRSVGVITPRGAVRPKWAETVSRRVRRVECEYRCSERVSPRQSMIRSVR